MNMKKMMIAATSMMMLTACSKKAVVDTPSATTTPESKLPEVTTTPESTSLGSSYPAYQMAYVVQEATLDADDAIDGTIVGYAGETLSTAFFDFQINDAYLFDRFESFTASEGNYILAVNVTITNPSIYDVPMFDTDFAILWYDADESITEEKGYTYSLLDDDSSKVTGDILPLEYTLKINESATGYLVFEVPDTYRYFSLAYIEIYSDDSEGNTFYLDFEFEDE